jgi:hypothetical protein
VSKKHPKEFARVSGIDVVVHYGGRDWYSVYGKEFESISPAMDYFSEVTRKAMKKCHLQNEFPLSYVRCLQKSLKKKD